MTDRTCPTCNYKFPFPSRLKNHFQISTHCKISNTEIDIFFNNTNNNITNNNTNNETIYKCLKCNNTYLNKYTLKKHQTVSKCALSITTKQETTDITNPTIVPLTYSNIKKLQKKEEKKVEQNVINNNNTTNNNTINNIINNNNNNNNLIINNIIQHIYPFGFEKLPNISKEEMKKLLLSGDKGVIEIIKLVYEQDENKNFYKINLKNNDISYLNNKYKLDICQEKEMKATLYKNCISLPNDMLVICKDILTTNEILFINSNNKSIFEKIKEEIYDNGLKNIINKQIIYNSKTTKQNIDKYINILNTDPIVKQAALDNLDNVINIIENTKTEFIPKLSLNNINSKLGDPIYSKDLTVNTTHNDFCMKKFEDTKYKKYWDKRKKDEENLILSLSNKSIGDIVELDCRVNKIENKLNKMKYIHKDITFNKKLENVEIASDYVINNRKNLLETKSINNDIANITDLQYFEEI